MAGYRKEFLDHCLVAIVSELRRVDEMHPDWPDDMGNAAKFVSDKARELLSASAGLCCGNAKDNNRILREAIQTGAMVLRFLLSMDNGLRREMVAVDERDIHEFWESD